MGTGSVIFALFNIRFGFIISECNIFLLKIELSACSPGDEGDKADRNSEVTLPMFRSHGQNFEGF